MAATSQLERVSETPGQIIAKYQREAPVNVLAIARELGINVWEMHNFSDTISGKIFRDPLNGGSSGFSIAVNAKEAPVRKRFTIAHEIAHFILHRDRITDELVEDTLYRGGLGSKAETQANKLAADILMPYSLINRLMSEGVTNLTELARKLQVSEMALRIRLNLPAA